MPGVLSFLRLRPSTNSAQADSFVRASDTTAVQVQTSTAHHFYHVFPPESDQCAVYDGTLGPYVEGFFSGTSVAALTWGPTNSGKTYTMCGDTSHPGLLPRVATAIGHRLAELSPSDNLASTTELKCSYLEVYNEQILDLLAAPVAPTTATPIKQSKNTSKLKVEIDREGATHVRGLEEITVKSTDELFALIARGQAQRTTEATLCNRQSSRSHCLLTFTLHVDGKPFSRLALVDLAGSEGVKKTAHTMGERLTEANHINKSLGVLGRCFDALSNGNSHVPFRSSKLTMLLAPFFNGSAVILLIVSINPDPEVASESVNALKYAATASDINIKSKIDTGQPLMSRHPMINEVRDLMAEALADAQSLARDLAKTQRELCGDVPLYVIDEELESKHANSSPKRAKLARSGEDNEAEVCSLRMQLAQASHERDESKRKLALVSAQLDNPFLVVASTEGRSLMAEGAHFTRVFLRESQVVSTPVFVFLKPRGPIGELHWMVNENREDVNAINLMTREIKTDSLPLHLVSDVHMGKCTKSLKSKFCAGFRNNCCFSVSSTATGQILNLVSGHPEAAFTWLFGINCLLTRLGKGVRVEDDELLMHAKDSTLQNS